ncbi:hypothetical protein M408DRAFT_321069 [Serendipita vermifera MAFF 305830]|uniref:Aquaporin n=1 Tax=Serendipita vermifera MAFF 305830 TaxID=933852 RepID=A0A0C3AVR5_SERVB|nr:hypothetical protein M408DRAFT_321069 [Serendipita vermifera MAFF 305830]
MAPSRRIISKRDLREDIKAASIEFIGTFVFLLLALGAIQSVDLGVARTQGVEIAENGPRSTERNIYVSVAAGVSLLGSAWMFYRTTGGLFNPSVTLALRLIGQITTMQLVLYIIAQLVGSIAASAVILGLFPGPLFIRSKLGEGTTLAQGVFLEMFATSILILAILMLAAEKSRATPMAPIGISMTLFACHLFSISATGTSLNPARTFGPAVIAGFRSDHWVYWVGPFAGSCLSVAFYAWLKHTRYWDINPHQMDTDPKESPEDPVKGVKKDIRHAENQRTTSKSGRQNGASGESGDEKRHGDQMV